MVTILRARCVCVAVVYADRNLITDATHNHIFNHTARRQPHGTPDQKIWRNREPALRAHIEKPYRAGAERTKSYPSERKPKSIEGRLRVFMCIFFLGCGILTFHTSF
ncbi:hypothetical protein BOTBODRAFT_349540 [Botryobasidium botryosum FD-172 SS1]|uniref:Uncharacterized protein n=1 Tax=Botryobasidium botryosum (strain FD-172 SS1) TaxID=930990 RepID=A0A067MR90_BOTB1|nr:hypothetical protein BOTBODRAFT_349540 [Botryobasidium botryosum FD-172 SS1]